MAQTDNEEDTLDLFQEPEGYYKEREKPADVTHRTLSGNVLQLHLSSQNPLWVGEMGTERTSLTDWQQNTACAWTLMSHTGPPSLARRADDSGLSRNEQISICSGQDCP